MNRSTEQRIANELDRKVFNILRACEGQLDDRTTTRVKWHAIAAALRVARTHLRGMMHADDVKETQ